MQPTRNGFCFLDDKYFTDFPDSKLMSNHGKGHGRPCFFCMHDKQNPDIMWLIPVSTKVQKYSAIMQKKIDRRGACHTIVIGKAAGKQSAFLIQNMCPVTQNYIQNQYILNGKPVRISEKLAKEIRVKAQRSIRIYQTDKTIIFPDIDKIKAALIAQLAKEKQQAHTQAKAPNQTPKKRRPVMRKKDMGKDHQRGR